MDNGIKEYIEVYGGKHGVLEYLKDNGGELADLVAPSVVFGCADDFGQKLENFLERASNCEFIVRSSHKNDWDGLVDAMETKQHILEQEVRTALMDVKDSFNFQPLKIYAEAEGMCFSPEDCTLSVTPNMAEGEVSYTLTESPDVPGLLYCDSTFFKRGEVGGTSRNAHNWGEIFQGRKENELAEEIASAAQSLRNALRELGVFADDEALQLEFGMQANGKPVLFQVKKFADVRPANKFLDKPHDPAVRVFGNTEEEGVRVKIIKQKSKRSRGGGRFDRFKAPMLLQGKAAMQQPLTLSDRYSGLAAYVAQTAGGSLALGHNHTRPVHAALKNDGFSFLGSGTQAAFSRLRADEEVTVFVDGCSWQIQKANGDIISPENLDSGD